MGIALWIEQNIGIRLLMLHDKLYKSTDGRIGHRIPLPGVAPSLLLHTVGAKTGQQAHQHAVLLSRRRRATRRRLQGRRSPKAPGWYHNLKAHPDVEINIGPKRFAVTATPVTADDPDYPRLWKLVNDDNSNRYEGYQKRTSRADPAGPADARRPRTAPWPAVRAWPPGRARCAGSTPRKAEATGWTITSSTSNFSASARTWSAASAGAPTTAWRSPASTTAWRAGRCAGASASSTRSSGTSGCPVRSRAIICRFGRIKRIASSRVSAHDGVDRQERDRLRGQVAGPEVLAVEPHRLLGALTGEVVGEHVRQALGGGQPRGVHRRTQQPQPRAR